MSIILFCMLCSGWENIWIVELWPAQKHYCQKWKKSWRYKTRHHTPGKHFVWAYFKVAVFFFFNVISLNFTNFLLTLWLLFRRNVHMLIYFTNKIMFVMFQKCIFPPWSTFQWAVVCKFYLPFTFVLNISFSLVSAHVDGQSAEQSRPVAGLHSHRKKCPDRNQSTNPHPKNLPSLLWPHG